MHSRCTSLRVLWHRSTTLSREVKLTLTLTTLCIPTSSGLKLTYSTGDWSSHSMSLRWIFRPIHTLSMFVILGKRVVMKSETQMHDGLWFYTSLKKKQQKKTKHNFQVTNAHSGKSKPIEEHDPPCSTWSDIVISVPLTDWQSSLAYLKVTGFILIIGV